jgi:phenylalanyl-tRNA synthetase beta chain
MNILVPDSWLRKFLDTKATPLQIKEYLSLCGPSIERIYEESGEPVYDIEITTNRPDAMSVFGVAREASVILPRFGIAATLLHDPYTTKNTLPKPTAEKKLTITTDAQLNPRWTSIIISNVTVQDSPMWLKDWLTKTGIRPINTVVDVTNYLMRAYGQPAHAFDYDRISGHTMKLRASKKGEKLTTLDGKTHTLPGDDIVIEDGTGKLIDLCGIMGGENSSITDTTKTVILFLQTYDPSHIRKTSMKLGHRTDAAGLFEKGVDSELVMPALVTGAKLLMDIAGGAIASKIYDLYPKPYTPYTVSAKREKVDSYVGSQLSDKEISSILTSLGFTTKVTKQTISVTVPSFRRDVTIDVDIIEEIARIHGYFNIDNRLPQGEMPSTIPSPVLKWEEDIKLRLRDWGFTELVTYSMISEKIMETFGFDKTKTYTISNPLSNDWVYMRPHSIASTLPAFIQNMNERKNLKMFELSMSYVYQSGNLPDEQPVLNVLWSGEKFLEAKGLAESIFELMGIDFQHILNTSTENPSSRYTDQRLSLGEYASLGIVHPDLLHAQGTNMPITRLYINIGKMVAAAQPRRTYIPVPKHPPSVEDLAFTVPDKFAVGPLIEALKHVDPHVCDVTLLDVHGNTRTLHITYLDPKKTLTNEEIAPLREKLLECAKHQFKISLKTN